jgi:hypothetical protein
LNGSEIYIRSPTRTITHAIIVAFAAVDEGQNTTIQPARQPSIEKISPFRISRIFRRATVCAAPRLSPPSPIVGSESESNINHPHLAAAGRGLLRRLAAHVKLTRPIRSRDRAETPFLTDKLGKTEIAIIYVQQLSN